MVELRFIKKKLVYKGEQSIFYEGKTQKMHSYNLHLERENGHRTTCIYNFLSKEKIEIDSLKMDFFLISKPTKV